MLVAPSFFRLLRLVRRSPVQTFILIPLSVYGFEAIRRRRRPRVHAGGVALMVGGWLLYRQAGAYRRSVAGGRGMATMPRSLVISGLYAHTRNPMYLGHLVFVAGLALALHSPLALVMLLERWRRFSARVRVDEERLAISFGTEYANYLRSVPRWLPALPYECQQAGKWLKSLPNEPRSRRLRRTLAVHRRTR